MAQEFYQDFARAAQVQWERERLQLQKHYSALHELFKPSQKQTGNSSQDIFLGKVDYLSSDSDEAFGDTPVIQHPSISTRQNKLDVSDILVAVPRKVAQVTGTTVEAKAQSYVQLCMAAAMRKKESQINSLLSESYQINTIMDGLDEQDATQAHFTVANNRISDYSTTAGVIHYLDLMRARTDQANAMGKGVGEMGMRPDAARTIDDINYIMYCENSAWLAFVAQNRNTYFNRDFSDMVGQAFNQDGLKVATLQDMALITTSESLNMADTFAGRFTNNRGVATGGAIPANFTTNFKPIYIFPRGAFETKAPAAQDYSLTLKELPHKKFEQALYGECNIYGKRIYDELVYRYWIDITNVTAIT